MKSLVFSLVISTIVIGCTSQSSTISRQIASQLQSQSAPIDISTVGPQNWQRFCILPPYTNNAAAEQILGFKWNAENKTSIASSDSINVLVFVQGNKVVAYIEHPRNLGDFSEMKPPCLQREKAQLNRRIGADGWVFLVVGNGS